MSYVMSHLWNFPIAAWILQIQKVIMENSMVLEK